MEDFTRVGIHDFYVFILVLSRVSGLMVTAPLFSNQSIPRTVKAGFALIFSMSLVPMAQANTGPVPEMVLILCGDIFKNALIGVALGYLARTIFATVEMAGAFVDTQMGFGMLQLNNPFTNHPDSVLSMFQFQLAFALYLLMNGHLFLLGAVAESIQTLPLAGISPQGMAGLTFVPVLQTMFTLAFRLALPAAGVLFVLDAAFGLVARLVPQINVFIVGIPGKIIVGLTTVAVLLPGFTVIVGDIEIATITASRNLVTTAKAKEPAPQAPGAASQPALPKER